MEPFKMVIQLVVKKNERRKVKRLGGYKVKRFTTL